ncbi:MAG: hypothetical protein H0W36_12015 [Gemmatimonadetes bacterium]|nr:hypothetical protein [Gemmatimonadota bacterium]
MRNASLGLLAVFFIALVSCQNGPEPVGPTGWTAPAVLKPARAAVFTENLSIPVVLEVSVPCAAGGAGEVVVLSGKLHILVHETINDNRFRVKLHFQPQGVSGVGLSTGDKYQGTGVGEETFGGSFVNGQFSDTFVNNFRIIGQGPGNNFLVHQTLHITVNANGEVTAEVDNFSIQCK